MKRIILITAAIACGAATGFGAECLPGSLSTYISASSPCTLGAVTFSNFELLTSGLDASLIGVNPGGTASQPSFTFALNGAAELNLHFRATAPTLTGYGIDFNGASVTDPAGLISILAVCAGGTFAGPGATDCSGDPGAALLYYLESFPQTSTFVDTTATTLYDAYFDFTADAATGGTATLTSATVSIGAAEVPEPASLSLVAAASALLLRRGRGKALSTARG